MEVEISQFADDTTLICRDTDALKQNMKVLNDFRDISGLRLNKKKTKAMWISSSKGNRTKLVGFQSYQEPIKIHKMDAKLKYVADARFNFIWLYNVKALGISKLVYAASMLCVPDVVIKMVQERLFKFLWKNKGDKVKRLVVMQNLDDGGLNFPNFLHGCKIDMFKLARRIFK